MGNEVKNGRWIKWLTAGTVAFFGLLFIAGIKLVKISAGQEEGEEIQGEADFSAHNVQLLRIPFNTAKIELSSGHSHRLAWTCRAAGGDRGPRVEIQSGIATLGLDQLDIARCIISLPNGVPAEIRGVNGHMEVRKPASALNIELNNGKVNIEADPKTAYDFDVNVKNGLQDFFPRSSKRDAVKVRVNVVNGMVNKE